MAEHYSFFDAQGSEGSYDRTYSSADLAAYFASFIGNGVYADPANQLKVSAASGKMAVNVAVGKAWINGYFYELDESAKELTIATGNSNYGRIDLVVCSLNLSNRLIELKVIQGAASANPQEPSYSRTDDVYDLVLAKVNVEAGAVNLSNADITDMRPNATYCGFVTGVVEQIDTTGLFSQYDAEFNEWFSGIQGTLDGETAGNLANQIGEIQEQIEGTVPVSRGGTGQTSAENAANAFINALSEGIVGSIPDDDDYFISQYIGGGTSHTNFYRRTFEDGIWGYVKRKTDAAYAAKSLITLGTAAAPSTGTPNTIYIQLL